jgi:hypothetical protein
MDREMRASRQPSRWLRRLSTAHGQNLARPDFWVLHFSRFAQAETGWTT